MNIRELQSALEEFVFVGQARRLGVFDALDEKIDTAGGLSARMKFDRRATVALLDALVEMKYLKKRKEIYSITAETRRRLVARGGSGYEGDFWSFLLYLVNPWRTLPYVMKHGRPDRSSYAGFSMDDFIRGMDSPWKKRIAPEVVRLCLGLRKGAATVADIGGAPGTIAREFAGRGLATLIYDLKESNDVMRKELSRVKNISVMDGDATKSFPAGTFDIVFLGNLCHGQSPADNAKMFRMARECLSVGGMIAVFDNLKNENHRSATLALHMITQSPLGNVYTRVEYLGWLRDAGFRKLKVVKLSDPAWSVIVGYR
ncbi:MAG: methyltransferase domain-containing protein [Spirochaetes bacterium]|nr:methyltransferase domain-containing protein [Spirochaetota bacterium]